MDQGGANVGIGTLHLNSGPLSCDLVERSLGSSAETRFNPIERRTDELFRRLQGVEDVRVELDAAARDRRRLTS
jgi:hypothetical protein